MMSEAAHDVMAEAQRLKAEEQLRSSLEAIDEAFFWMSSVRDAQGQLVDFEYRFCNRTALRLLGRRSEDVVGRRLLELFPSHRANGLFDAYARVVQTGEPLRFEFAFDEHGVTGEFEVVVSRVDDGYVLAGHDVSDRKRAERELAEVKRQLETALTSRVVIEQAKGYVARANKTSVHAAFLVIRRYARNNNLKLRDVCQSVVAGQLPELTSSPAGE